MADIENLMKSDECKDFARIKKYFELFEKINEFEALIGKTGKNKNI